MIVPLSPSSQHQRTYKARVARLWNGFTGVTNVHTPGKVSRQHLESHTALTARAPHVNQTVMYFMYILCILFHFPRYICIKSFKMAVHANTQL